jgi:hypothetical protein
MMESAVGLVGFYINGVWEKPQGRTTLPVTNPATGAVLAEAPYATADDVDRAVRTAHDAFLKWREVPVVDRVQVLYRFKTLLEEHAAEVAAILTRENGKTAERCSQRRDLRTGPLRDSSQDSGRSHPTGEPFAFRQRHIDFHEQWQGRARILVPN